MTVLTAVAEKLRRDCVLLQRNLRLLDVVEAIDRLLYRTCTLHVAQQQLSTSGALPIPRVEFSDRPEYD
jgi:hypothetical protein